MKNLAWIIASILLLHSESKMTTSNDITIYYGLNESHSRNWVQINDDGIIGISYFQRFENSEDEGTLIYKTIHPDGTENIDEITNGTRLEISVLLYDEESNPHIFAASSNNLNQKIDHYYKNSEGLWRSETIINFYNEGGRFIYELSADTGPDGSFHLLILKTRSNVDSDDFMDAWINSYLYHLTNASGTWEKELIHNYDMAYTFDMYLKSSIRQDIKVDDDGYVHVTFGEQINGNPDPSRLRYSTNKTGSWVIETAFNYDAGSRDDAGWFPSLCLDSNGIPHISCMYINRVPTGSAMDCKLHLLKRLGANNWESEIVAEYDDGYYGSDGRDYTGGLSHLVFDKYDTPHIIFTDIASTHWPGTQRLNAGNIRYGIFENGEWNFTTIYRQPNPTDFFTATEMHAMCLIISDETDTIRIIGQELVTITEHQYTTNLLNFTYGDVSHTYDPEIHKFTLHQNFPNPFNPTTQISYSISNSSFVTLKVYDLLGNEVKTLVNEFLPAAAYTINFDAEGLPSGVYFYKINVGSELTETKKMLVIR